MIRSPTPCGPSIAVPVGARTMSLNEPDVTQGGSATSLALRVLTAGPGPERERAMVELEPVVRRLARRVACAAGAGSRRARDLEEEAPAYLWERLVRFDPDRARFET